MGVIQGANQAYSTDKPLMTTSDMGPIDNGTTIVGVSTWGFPGFGINTSTEVTPGDRGRFWHSIYIQDGYAPVRTTFDPISKCLVSIAFPEVLTDPGQQLQPAEIILVDTSHSSGPSFTTFPVKSSIQLAQLAITAPTLAINRRADGRVSVAYSIIDQRGGFANIRDFVVYTADTNHVWDNGIFMSDQQGEPFWILTLNNILYVFYYIVSGADTVGPTFDIRMQSISATGVKGSVNIVVSGLTRNGGQSPSWGPQGCLSGNEAYIVVRGGGTMGTDRYNGTDYRAIWQTQDITAGTPSWSEGFVTFPPPGEFIDNGGILTNYPGTRVRTINNPNVFTKDNTGVVWITYQVQAETDPEGVPSADQLFAAFRQHGGGNWSPGYLSVDFLGNLQPGFVGPGGFCNSQCTHLTSDGYFGSFVDFLSSFGLPTVYYLKWWISGAIVLQCNGDIVGPNAGYITGAVGVFFDKKMNTQTGDPNDPYYVVTLVGGTLPPGIVLQINSPTDVHLIGTPTKAGDYPITLRFTDPKYNTYAEITCFIRITTLGLVFLPPGGKVGVLYAYTPTISGGIPPYHVAITGGNLPPGLSMNLVTGAITGTPTTKGSYPISITVFDSVGQSASASGVIIITDFISASVQCCITITGSGGGGGGGGDGTFTADCTGVPSVATIGVLYTGQITVSGGSPPFTFTLISGSLPPGLTLNSANGAIFGIPTNAANGTYTFTILVTDFTGATVQVTCSITVGCNTRKPRQKFNCVTG